MHEYDKWIWSQSACWLTCCQSASTGPVWRPAAVCRHENWAHGRLFEVEVCSPQLFFHSLPWEVRRWGDKLLTTLRNPPHPHPPLPPGCSTDGRKSLASPHLTLFLNFAYSSCLFSPSPALGFQVQPPTPTPPHHSHLLSCQSGSVLWGLFIYNSGGLKHTRNVKIITSRDFDEICLLVAGICWLH